MFYGNTGNSTLYEGSFEVTYTCIEGGQLGTGNTTLSSSPFRDHDGADGVPGTIDDDLHLAGGSSCRNSGDNASVPAELTTDLDGEARVQGTVDRGAYED